MFWWGAGVDSRLQCVEVVHTDSQAPRHHTHARHRAPELLWVFQSTVRYIYDLCDLVGLIDGEYVVEPQCWSRGAAERGDSK